MVQDIKPSIFWIREDLRIHDQPILSYCAKQRSPVLMVYIYNPEGVNIGGRHSQAWLRDGLLSLDQDLRKRDSYLWVQKGPYEDVLADIIASGNYHQVLWYESYHPQWQKIDNKIKRLLRDHKHGAISYQVFPPSSALYHPGDLLTAAGAPQKSFSQFWKKALSLKVRSLAGHLDQVIWVSEEKTRDEPTGSSTSGAERKRIIDLFQSFVPRRTTPELAPEVSPISTPKKEPEHTPHNGTSHQAAKTCRSKMLTSGEHDAYRALREFLTAIKNYKNDRNRVDLAITSRLSAYLAWGQITPHQILVFLNQQGLDQGHGPESFIKEVGWREYGIYLMYHFPQILLSPLDRRYEEMPYQDDPESLKKWQQGKTGYPLIDAAMTELKETGWMHGRNRMVVASFLCKNLLIDWRWGEQWFREHLTDYCPSQNAMNWQWVAGCGVDASPYFRVFNPVLQAQTFDPRGDYIRSQLPHLAPFPTQWLHDPLNVPSSLPPEPELAELKKRWDEVTPAPLVNIHETRKRALDAYHSYISKKNDG